MAPQPVDDLQGLVAALGGASGSLQEAGAARAGHRIFEEIQSVVIVEHLDGVGDGNHLFAAGLGALIPIGALRGAALLKLGEELLVGDEGLLGVGELVLELGDRHAEVADILRLGLDRIGEGQLLLLLGGHELLVVLDGGVLNVHHVRAGLFHLVTDLLQDARDLTALGCVLVAILGREEGQDSRAVLLIAELVLGQDALQDLSG
mmetsp:Transcript_54959/g.141705  ORF Transcript_54959/g.141705 Transcript_54959/m.141705 type:complete len:205 (-) Transcript_54959:334-948(-)